MSTTNLPPHSIRHYEVGDRQFILDSWVKSAKALPVYAWVPNGIYYRAIDDMVAYWVDGGKMTVALAVNPDDAQQIYGYCAWSLAPLVCHYAYVKAPWRRVGLATRLVALTGAKNISHWPLRPWRITARMAYSPEQFMTETILAEIQRGRQRRNAGVKK